MTAAPAQPVRCARETVAFARVERLLRDPLPADLEGRFTARELEEAGTGPAGIARLAARVAAREACAQLFPRETGARIIQPLDFSLAREGEGAGRVEVSPQAREVLDRHRVADLQVSLAVADTAATAVVTAEPRPTDVPWFGRWLYHLFPYRRQVVFGNLRRVFGDVLPADEIRRLAQAYYAHYVRFLIEFVRLPFMSRRQRQAWIRIENVESPLRAHAQGKGILLVTGHFGNFEVATVAGITQFPEYRGQFYFVRRPLKPQWLNRLVTWRFRRAGFGTLPKRGSLEAILDALAGGAIVVYPFDQHAGGKDGVTVDFFGHPCGTFKSVALLALTTGAPVIPACSWREPDGSHVLQFEDPLPLLDCEDVGEAIRRNTRAYNAALERMLLRHPEQWIWMHRRWKPTPNPRRSRPMPP